MLFCSTPCYAPWVATANRNARRFPLIDPPSRCTIHRIILIEQGTLRTRTAGREQVVRPGQILLLLPGVDYHLDPGPGLRVASCSFSVRALPDPSLYHLDMRLGTLALDPQPQEVWGCDLPEVLPPQEIELVLPLLHRITAIWWQGDRERFEGNRLLGDLLAHWTALRLGSPSPGPFPFSMEELTAFVEERLERGVTVADLVRFSGQSRSHFSRNFHQRHGQAPRDFLRRCRFDRARRLLATTSLDCQAVARACGYASYSAFANGYRTCFGEWPSSSRD